MNIPLEMLNVVQRAQYRCGFEIAADGAKMGKFDLAMLDKLIALVELYRTMNKT